MTYRIVPFFQPADKPKEILKTGVSLEEAQAHCASNDTHGEGWFDGFEKE